MAKSTRRSPQTRISRGIFVALCTLGLLVLLSGFITWTRTALDIQAHAPPGAEHPYDFYAEACLGGVLLLLAVLFLSRPTPRRWRKAAPASGQNAQRTGAKGAKRRRGSGYNKPK